MAVERSRTFIWRFDRPAAAIWPILSDTARFNEAADLPKHTITETPREDGSVRYTGHARLGPFTLRWDEKPVTWVHERWFEHCRYFHNGPLAFLCARVELVPEGPGCRCEYTATAAARGLFGRLLLATAFFPRIEKTFTPLAESAARHARGARDTPFDVKPPRLAPGARPRSAALVAKIEATPHGHGLAQRLADFVLERQEVDVWTIRPLRLARLWGVPAREAIEVCLEAVKQGLLRLRWDLLCPRCQVAKGSALALDELPTGAHCGTCNIDYGRDLSDNIELAFHPANAVRPIESGEYCLFGPMSTPHIKLQLEIASGASETVDIGLEPGRYRVRTLEPGAEQTFEWAEGGFPRVTAEGDRIVLGEPARVGQLELCNRSGRALTFIVEDRVWARDALTAKRAIALQAFRDLFDEEVLRPGDHVEIDHVALMFTDLKGSTALYERIGDPQAYALVREHFAILGRAVRAHDGVVVKTIGDAIMAAFDDSGDAFDCAVRIHADFAAYNGRSGREPAIIKLGLHVGRCISVTLNNRLDYYGTAANKAARLQGQSTGGDIVMSPEFARDPLVARRLAGFRVRGERAPLKGFEKEVAFLRIPAEDLAAKRETPLPPSV